MWRPRPPLLLSLLVTCFTEQACGYTRASMPSAHVELPEGLRRELELGLGAEYIFFVAFSLLENAFTSTNGNFLQSCFKCPQAGKGASCFFSFAHQLVYSYVEPCRRGTLCVCLSASRSPWAQKKTVPVTLLIDERLPLQRQWISCSVIRTR